MLRKYILFLKKYPLITAAIAVVYGILCIKLLKADNNLETAVHRSMLSGAMMFFLYQISGDKTLTGRLNSTWYVIKVALGFWLVSLPLGFFAFLGKADGEVLENVPLQLLIVFVMFLFVGLFEELCFRAIINDAIIYQFRDKKYVFVLSALCSFFVFGAAHVVGTPLNSAMAWIQAILKTIQSGMLGLGLLFLYWKTRNIWACGVVHGVSDFILAFHLGIFKGSTDQITYIATDESAKAAIVLYLIMIAIYGVITFFIYRRIGKKIDYQKIREEW